MGACSCPSWSWPGGLNSLSSGRATPSTVFCLFSRLDTISRRALSPLWISSTYRHNRRAALITAFKGQVCCSSVTERKSVINIYNYKQPLRPKRCFDPTIITKLTVLKTVNWSYGHVEEANNGRSLGHYYKWRKRETDEVHLFQEDLVFFLLFG